MRDGGFPEALANLKRSFGKEELLALAASEELRHRGSGRNRAECPGCRNDDPRGASIGESEGVGVWKCHRDEKHAGTAIDFLAFSRGLSIAESIEALAHLAGRVQVQSGPRSAPAPTRPPAAEVAAVWAACRPLTMEDDVAEAWASRGIDIAHAEDRGLARALPRGAHVPRWARCAGRSWSESQHRLILPLYDDAGRLGSLHARTAEGHPGMPKGLSPAGYAVAGLVMADRLARLLLADEALGDGTSSSEAVRERDLIVVEGAPDFLTWTTRYGDAAEGAPAVIGIISGSWTPAIAARVPTGTCVVVRAHADAAGAKYAAWIRETLVHRCRVRITVAEGGR